MSDYLSDHPMLGDGPTGLPPLSIPEPDETLLAMVWTTTEGIAYSPFDDSTPAVRVLSVRGLRQFSDGTAEWAQVHIAVPVEALDVLRRVLS